MTAPPAPAQPAPVQPAHISPKQLLALAQEANLGLDKVIEVFQMAAPAAQPAPVQECEAFEAWHDSFFVNKGHAAHHRFHDRDGYCIDDIQNQWKGWKERAKRTTPPAAAVPDAITDNSESLEYRTGWNDCRQVMLEMMK